MKRENQTYARTLNRRLKGWDKEGTSSDLVEETRANLEMFYEKYGIEADDNFFATDLHLSEQAEREYERLLDSFGDKAGSSVNEMRRAYDEVAEDYEARFNVHNFDEYIKFTDKMKQAQNDRILKNIISSDQIAELYTIASQQGMSGDTVDELLLFEYQSHQQDYDNAINVNQGNANDPLYRNMLDILEDLSNDEDMDRDLWD